MSDEKLNVTISADGEELKKSLDEAASKLNATSKVSKELANASQKAANSEDNLAKSSEKAADETEKTAKAEDEAADSAKKLAEETDNAAEAGGRLAEASEKVAKGADKEDKSWKTIGQAFDFVSSTIEKMMGQMAKVGQEAQKMGVSAESFQVLKMAAEEANVDFEAFTSSFDKVRQAVSQASAGNEDMALSLAELGLRYEDLMSLSPEDQFFAVTQALSELEDEGERNRLGTALLGDEYVKIAGRLEEFSAKSVEAKGNAAIISDKDIETAQRYQQSMEKLSSTLEKISMTVLGPVIRDFSESLDEMYSMMSKHGFWGSIKELTGFGDVMEDAAKPISQDELAQARRNMQQRKVADRQKEEKREERAQVREEAKKAIEAKREEPARQDAARQAQWEERERQRAAERAARDQQRAARDQQRAAEQAARDEQTRQRNLFDARRALNQAEMRLADLKARHKAEAEKRETNAQLAELDRRQKAIRKAMGEDTVPRTARERRLRRRNLRLDESIAHKQSQEKAGERVTYTPRERKRMREREKAEKEIAAIETQKEKIRQRSERREERRSRQERKRQLGEAERGVGEAKARIRDLEAKASPQSDGVAASGMKASKSTSFAPSPLAKGAAGASAAVTGPSAIGQQLSAIQAILQQMSTKFYFVQG
ncbi:MAG: hypothetical protein ACI4WT_10705 [Oligosphaeraceae bacterium]